MLHARINREYIDDDEMAKKKTFERTLAWVNKLYPEESREVAMQQGTLSGSEIYAFDSMFESFRNSIETALSSDYHDQTTHEKSNEVIKKYQISSYLKKIVNMNKLTEQDEAKIKNEFNALRAKLEQLKRIAIDNNFSDQHDIVQMVDKINNTSNVKTCKKAENDKISAE